MFSIKCVSAQFNSYHLPKNWTSYKKMQNIHFHYNTNFKKDSVYSE